MAVRDAVDEIVTVTELPGLARRVLDAVPPGGVLWLSGDIGSGKTTLTRALAEQAGTEPARSPTFALVHEYPGSAGTIAHVDCYRLRHPDEAADVDFDGLVRASRLVVVEWPERGGAHVPAPDVHLELSHVDDPSRRQVRWRPCP